MPTLAVFPFTYLVIAYINDEKIYLSRYVKFDESPPYFLY